MFKKENLVIAVIAVVSAASLAVAIVAFTQTYKNRKESESVLQT